MYKYALSMLRVKIGLKSQVFIILLEMHMLKPSHVTGAKIRNESHFLILNCLYHGRKNRMST